MTFRLSTLLIGVTAAAVGLFLLTVAPPVLAVPALVTLWLMLFTSVLAGIVWGRGRLRAFCIGAMAPAGGTVAALVWLLCVWLMAGRWEMRDTQRLLAFLDEFAFTFRVWSAAGWLLVVVTGLTCIFARAMLRGITQECGDD